MTNKCLAVGKTERGRDGGLKSRLWGGRGGETPLLKRSRGPRAGSAKVCPGRLAGRIILMLPLVAARWNKWHQWVFLFFCGSYGRGWAASPADLCRGRARSSGSVGRRGLIQEPGCLAHTQSKGVSCCEVQWEAEREGRGWWTEKANCSLVGLGTGKEERDWWGGGGDRRMTAVVRESRSRLEAEVVGCRVEGGDSGTDDSPSVQSFWGYWFIQKSTKMICLILNKV